MKAAAANFAVDSAGMAGAFRGEEGSGIIGAPYSGIGTMETVTKLLDGNRIVHTQVTRFFRDGQGRTRVERTSIDPGSKAPRFERAMVTIADPSKAERYMLNSFDKSATVLMAPNASQTTPPPVPPPAPTVHFSAANIGFGSTALHDAPKTVSLGEKTIDGIRVVGTRADHTIPAGLIGNEKPIVTTAEQWFSPDLGVVIESTNRSPTGSETTYRLAEISRHEPDPALFVVPPDYTRQEIGERTRGFSTTILQPLRRE